MHYHIQETDSKGNIFQWEGMSNFEDAHKAVELAEAVFGDCLAYKIICHNGATTNDLSEWLRNSVK